MESTSEKIPTTPKDFFLWLGIIITLYWSILSLGHLLFLYITYHFASGIDTFDPYQSGISFDMASILVLFPLFLILSTVVYRDRKKDVTKDRVWVRRWAIFLTLFLSGIALAADLITLLNTFFNGNDIATAFLLKVAVVFLLSVAVFWYFTLELRGYWYARGKALMTTGGVALLLVLSIIGIGFLIVGSPQHARMVRMDAQRISDLQALQSDINVYYAQRHTLPTSLSDLESIGFALPADPSTGAQYGYTITQQTGFSLCATFAASGTSQVPGGFLSQEMWSHGAGYTCFARAAGY